MSATYGLYIGLMSGTSLDGIDAALVSIEAGHVQLKSTYHRPYPDSLRQQLNQLCHADSPRLADLLQLDVVLAEEMATAVNTLLEQNQLQSRDVIAIGSHGQTIRHLPDNDRPNTLQIADPNHIAQRTGITTIADFRRRDMAAGGQGAPLVPAFHQALFQADTESRVAINIGGISNITVLPATHSQQKVIGFDTGPGNCLMDYWVQQHRQHRFDENGQWAAQGSVIKEMLMAMQADAYFSKPAPKSSGREYFNPDWLGHFLKPFPWAPAEDVQATLCQLTAWCITDAIKQMVPDVTQLILCGGGAQNQTLVKMLKADLGADCSVVSSETYGIHPDWVEAMAFAWLAYRHEAGLPGNLPDVTGASEAVILGGRYPA